MRICSFDIGMKNFSVCIEEYDINFSKKEEFKFPKIKFNKQTSESTDEYKSCINLVAKKGKVIFLERKELGDRKAYFSGLVYQNLYDWIDSLDEYIKTCDVVLIEQQMRVNNIAITLMGHLHAFLLLKYCRVNKENKKLAKDKKIDVKLYPSKNKTRVLGMALKEEVNGKLQKVTKYKRKKWSVDQVNNILKERKDEEWHEYIFKTNKTKKDDLSDVIMQNLSYIINQLN